jgi:ribosomal protein S18 acetylase RimI-like enzyme
MTLLVPVPAASFPAFLKRAIAGYAKQNVESGRWPAEAALELSRAEHQRLLPEGIASKDNHIFEIHDPATDAVVGSLWLGVQNRTGLPLAYVFNIEIAPEHRRRGHAARALKALEPIVRELGLSAIGLNVFAYNTGAQALYASLGYEVTALSMRKSLGNEKGV